MVSLQSGPMRNLMKRETGRSCPAFDRYIVCAMCVICCVKLSTYTVAPERIWKLGAPMKNFFWSFPSTFLALQVQLVVLVSAFVMVSIVWSVACLLFSYSRCPPCPAICKSGGGTCPLYSMESAPLNVGLHADILLPILILHILSLAYISVN